MEFPIKLQRNPLQSKGLDSVAAPSAPPTARELDDSPNPSSFVPAATKSESVNHPETHSRILALAVKAFEEMATLAPFL